MQIAKARRIWGPRRLFRPNQNQRASQRWSDQATRRNQSPPNSPEIAPPARVARTILKHRQFFKVRAEHERGQAVTHLVNVGGEKCEWI
jgi:hypothetical protein